MSNSTFLYPNVTSLPGQSAVAPGERTIKKQDGVKGEFDQVFDRALNPEPQADLSQVRQPLKFSAHASQRLKDRKITMDPATMAKVSAAVDKAEAKGVEDTLVLSGDLALIVNVKNRTVVTALDKQSMTGNVFTNIDGAVVM